MNDCTPCTGYDSMLTADEKALRQEEAAAERSALNKEININGVKLLVKDIFPSQWEARSFVNKLTLMEKAQGRAATEADDIVTDPNQRDVVKDIMVGGKDD